MRSKRFRARAARRAAHGLGPTPSHAAENTGRIGGMPATDCSWRLHSAVAGLKGTTPSHRAYFSPPQCYPPEPIFATPLADPDGGSATPLLPPTTGGSTLNIDYSSSYSNCSCVYSKSIFSLSKIPKISACGAKTLPPVALFCYPPSQS